MVVDSTEIYEAVPDTELISTEIVASDNSTPAVGSTVQTVDYASILDSIANDVHIIMFIVLFSFCWSCLKSWRTHSLKGVRK